MCASKLLSKFLIWKPQELLWSLQISLLAVHLPSRIACSLRSLLISFSDSVFTEIISQSEQRCAISEPRFISVIPMKSQVAWLRFLCLWHPFACQATISSSLFLPMTGSFRPSTYCSSQKSERVVQYDRATQNRVMRLCGSRTLACRRRCRECDRCYAMPCVTETVHISEQPVSSTSQFNRLAETSALIAQSTQSV